MDAIKIVSTKLFPKIEVKKGIVCPVCGTVYKRGKKFAQAYSLYSWTEKGYLVDKCKDCREAERNGNRENYCAS
jgi:hypothetical protein